jgi:hypothetical protein
MSNQSKLKIDTKGFDEMMSALRKKTGASYLDVLKASAGSILENTARRTGKSNRKKIVKSVDKTLQSTFVASNGDKLRKAKNGSFIYHSPFMGSNKFIRVSPVFNMKNIGAKNLASQSISKKYIRGINKGLSEMRKLRTKLINSKTERIASSQASFLKVMSDIGVGVKSTRSLGAAMKVKLSRGIQLSSMGKVYLNKDNPSILIKSTSQSSLNPHAGGIKQFARSFNGQVKSFQTALKKDITEYAKRFAKKNGFSIR